MPLQNGGGERKFLKDGDTVEIRGECYSKGRKCLGFGLCFGKVLPALQLGLEK